MRGIILLLACTHVALSTLLDDYIYFKYQNDLLAPPCVRLVNSTHQIGCSTGAYPQSGALVEVTTDSDIEFALKPGTHSPYIALLDLHQFSRQNLLKLYASDSVAGVLIDVYNQSGYAHAFSPQSQCPNSAGAKGNSDCNLNPAGNGLDFFDFNDFPIFAINDESILYNLKECVRHNKHISGVSHVCSVQLASRMYAAVNTDVCTRRVAYVVPQLTSSSSYCTFLQGWSVWGTLFPLPENTSFDNKENGVVIVAAQLDTSAFFHDLSHGAEHDLSAIATLIGIAEVLGRLKREGSISGNENPIVFALYDGDEWQRIGSSKMAYDISVGNFPIFPTINITHEGIKHFLSIGQVALSANQTWYIHSTESANKDSVFIDAFKDASYRNNISLAILDDGLGLHSTMSYFSHFNGHISGAVVTDYNDTYKNRFYGSFLDNENRFSLEPSSEAVQSLLELCQSLTESILAISNTTLTDGTDTACNSSLISQIFKCYLVNSSCPLFGEVSPPDLPESTGPVSRYVSVQTTTSLNSLMAHNLLAYFLGNRTTAAKDNCSVDISPTSNSLYRTYFSKGTSYNSSTQTGVCINSTVYYYRAISPSLELNTLGRDSLYSTWAESIWEAPSIWIYIASNNYINYGEFMLGFVMTVVTLVGSVIIKVRATQIFL